MIVHDVIYLPSSTLHQHSRTQELKRDRLVEEQGPEPDTIYADDEPFEPRHPDSELPRRHYPTC